MKTEVLIFVAFAAIAAGCISQVREEVRDGLAITLTADPQSIHYTEQMRLFVDMENKGNTDFRQITYSLFETGLLAPLAPCNEGSEDSDPGLAGSIKPGAIVSAECILAVAEPSMLISPATTTMLGFRAVLQTTLSDTVVLEILSREEWRRRITTGKLVQRQAKFSLRDENIAMSIEFTKLLPFVEAPGEKVQFTLKLRNAGNGFISELRPEQLRIVQEQNLVRCDFNRRIVPFSGEFPPIFCELTVAAGGAPFISYPVTFSVDYEYEVRKSVEVEIRR